MPIKLLLQIRLAHARLVFVTEPNLKRENIDCFRNTLEPPVPGSTPGTGFPEM
jgi:hypothetical protein